MASRISHVGAGAAVGLGAYALWKLFVGERLTLKGALLSALGGALVACAPDVLEPALHPNHRSLAHSLTALVSLLAANGKVISSQGVSPIGKTATVVLSAGYLSHLGLDALTPKGLPLVV